MVAAKGLACALMCSCSVTAFLGSIPNQRLIAFATHPGRPMALSTSAADDAEKLRQQAQRIRTEVLQLDSKLAEEKIATIEKKMDTTRWDENSSEEKRKLEQQLVALKEKLSGHDPSLMTSLLIDSRNSSEASAELAISNSSSLSSDNPIAGFEQADLVLYIPVVKSIEAEAPANATADELLKLFREAPELHEHFKEKMQEMFVLPMENIQELEEKKRKYLSSTSTVERLQLKREMKQLQKAIDSNGPVGYSETIFLDVPRMPDEELRQRLHALEELPKTLQVVYKMQNDVGKKGDLQLAILKEHYDLQLQLLDQAKYAMPIDKSTESDIRRAIASLPNVIKDDLKRELGVNEDGDDSLYQALLTEGENLSIVQGMNEIFSSGGVVSMPSEYDDIDFIDRSRYLKELYPSIAQIEGNEPSLEEVNDFVKLVLDQAFMQTSPPERVLGCYYIRGQNLLTEDEDGTKLMKRLNARYENSTLAGTLDFFYVLDPSPLSDEALEMGDGDEPVIIVTRRNRDILYFSASPLTKLAVSCAGIVSCIIFALGTCDLQPNIQNQLDNALTGDIGNFGWIADLAWTTAASLIGIQIFHEVGHASIAMRDRFQIGLPTVIPSIQLGIQGSITPIKSPPPSYRSLFDFAMAGPTIGMLAATAILFQGLALSVATPVSDISNLPALPTAFLRTSALGGSIIEFFFGSRDNVLAGDLLRNSDVLSLHPLAIAGYVGLISNALALLPLGNTDGGRISLAMFGRRGAFVVKAFAALLICLAGIFGFDDANILLVYVLFCIFCQRDLENPVQNEVEQLDFGRGAFAIFMAIVVGLTLCPMT